MLICLSGLLLILIAMLTMRVFAQVNSTAYSSEEKMNRMLHSAFDQMKHQGFRSGHIYFPQNIPNGFTISEIDSFPDSCWIDFVGEDSAITFRQMAVTNINRFSVVYDTKNADKAKVISIDGYDAYLVKNEKYIKVSYCNDDYFFTITCYNVDEPQAIRFASDLKRISLANLTAKANG